jgi:adenylate cyclase
LGGSDRSEAVESPGDELWRRLGLTEGERRTVTVVFADVTGFTALSETMDPEAMQLVMRDTMSLLADCVQAEGGTLEKFIGDALCAIFGAPVAHVDEPERAARACLAMHRALAERATARPDLPPMTVHAGINTGPVIAGAVGDGTQFGVMGDTINTAARLMGLAGDGETYVSATTARRLRRGFRLQDAGLHEVKGKSEPLAVASVVGELSESERETQRRLRAPLVGRDHELVAVRNLAARAGDGDGVVVLIVGEAGSGVSRLAGEVASGLDDHGWRVLRASARVQAETPLGLVATALAPLLADATDSATRSVADALLTGGVAAPHDFELALGTVVKEAAKKQPLLVVLDDIDDADPGSVEVIRYLSRTTADEPVLWLLTGERVPAVFDPVLGTADAVLVRAGPLSDAAVNELFEALLPGALTGAQLERLAHLAEGSPQFAVEIAHALVEEGVVVEAKAGRWVVVGDADHIALPGSVAELIEARIDQLPTQARITLQDAAVIGLRFSSRLLQRVATIPTSLDAALAELADAELVLPPDDGGLWRFRSRLVREVAYDSLLRRRRPPAHRAVADALLELEADRTHENADLIAHHFEEGDDPPLALPHLKIAIDRAERAYNFTGALDRAKRAVKLRDRFPGRVDDADTAWLLQQLGTMKLLLGDQTGLDELQQAAGLLTDAGTPEAVVSLQERVGWYLTMDGQHGLAGPYLEAAQAGAESKLDGAPRAAALAALATTRAFVAAASGDLATGLAAAERAVAEAREAGDRFTEARALLVSGVSRLWAGEPVEAVERLRTSLDLAWEYVFGTLADRCGRWLVQALVESGRDAEAAELAEPLLARSDDRGDPSVGCGVRAGLAKSAWLAGDLARARSLATVAVQTSEQRKVASDAAAEARLLLAEVAIDEANPSDPLAVAAATAEVEGHLAAVAELAVADKWLAWRWQARSEALRDRLTRKVDPTTVPRS